MAVLSDRSTTPPKQEHGNCQPRVLLADDNDPLLSQVARLLQAEFQVVGTASNGRDLLEAADRIRPDLIACDITMPLVDGLEAARRLRETGSSVKIIFLTMQDESDYRRESLSAGAMGYVIKDKLLTDLSPAFMKRRRGASSSRLRQMCSCNSA